MSLYVNTKPTAKTHNTKSMKTLRLLCQYIFLALMALQVQAQDNFDMGIISPSDMNLEYYQQKYPDASAVIISYITDYGYTNRHRSDLLFSTTVKKRMIILRESGLQYGDVSIPFFNMQGSGESIVSFQANIYNLQGNRIQRHRVRKHQGFVNSVGNHWHHMVFALPGVKVGSVIEYTYEKVSDFRLEPRHWTFQKEIPVVFAMLNLKQPSFLQHQIGTTGLMEPNITRIEIVPSRYVIHLPLQMRDGTYTRYSHRFSDNSMKRTYVMRDIPAIRTEPFADQSVNYVGGLLYLFSEENPSKWDWSEEDTLATWARINKKILRYPAFSAYYKLALEAVTPWLADTAGVAPGNHINWAFEQVHSRVSWNGRTTIQPGAPPEDVLELGYGNIAEVNLLLMALLRKMGFNTFPVLLSTLDNGRVRKEMPGTQQWNYLIVRVTDRSLPGGEILLDASAMVPMPGFIPERAINGKGLQVDEALTQWVCLEQNFTMKEKRHFHIQLHPNGDLSGTMELFIEDFGKFTWANLLSLYGEEVYWQFMETDTGLQFTNRSINTNTNTSEPLHVKADLFIPAYAQLTAHEVILPSLLIKTLEENPFKALERQSPVVFNYLTDSQVSMHLTYPDNYNLTYIPDHVSDSWQGFSYNYRWNHSENRVEVYTHTQRDFRRIEVDQYADFREFALRRLFNNTDSIVFEVSDQENSTETNILAN